MASFWNGWAGVTIITIGEVLAVVVPLLIAVAYLTYFERKVLAFSQLRKGPNVVGPFGLLQPFAAHHGGDQAKRIGSVRIHAIELNDGLSACLGDQALPRHGGRSQSFSCAASAARRQERVGASGTDTGAPG